MKRFIIIMISFCLITVSCMTVNNTLTYLRQNTDLPEKWFPLSDRLIFFSAEEAKKYRLVDEIITELP